ncbi:MAG: hypothetical protein J0L81_13740 [Caulobacterales bacterium]|jgi:predicted nuclease of predicted toxin-antitoxin system|nr:hypothetical protein [Caulobacterales bacterium]
MRFVVDQQLPPVLAKWFEERALRESAIVVTRDVDFPERRLREACGPTILWLRMGNTTKQELLDVMQRTWTVVEPALSREPIVEVR